MLPVERYSRLAKEWTRISRAWTALAALFTLSALCHIANLILLWE